MYVIEETTAYLITLLITGAYLAKLTLSLGFSDGLTALLSSFVNLGCVFQLFAISVFGHSSVKRKVTVFYTINELLFVLLYVTPLIKVSPNIRTILFVIFLLGGYFILNIAASPKTNWFMTLIPDKTRGRFTAFKEGVSLICGIVFSFFVGILVDYYEKAGNAAASFIACGAIIFALMMIHTLSLLFSKEKESTETNVEKNSFLKSTEEILCDKKTFSVILLCVLWTVCNAFSTPFFGTYQVKELNFSMTFVAVLSTVNAVSRIVASIFLGAYADKTSFTRMLRICFVLVAISFIAATLATPSFGHTMFILQSVFLGAAMGGINSAQVNLIFDYVSPEKRKNALSVKDTFCGLFGFGATLAATPLLNYLQKSGLCLLGVPIYAQQVLSCISFILTLILIAYISKFIKKSQKPYDN